MEVKGGGGVEGRQTPRGGATGGPLRRSMPFISSESMDLPLSLLPLLLLLGPCGPPEIDGAALESGGSQEDLVETRLERVGGGVNSAGCQDLPDCERCEMEINPHLFLSFLSHSSLPPSLSLPLSLSLSLYSLGAIHPSSHPSRGVCHRKQQPPPYAARNWRKRTSARELPPTPSRNLVNRILRTTSAQSHNRSGIRTHRSQRLHARAAHMQNPGRIPARYASHCLLLGTNPSET